MDENDEIQAAASQRMRIGVMPSLVERSLGDRPPKGRTPSFRDLQMLAQIADQVGLDSFWLADHLLYRFPDIGENGAWEVFTFLSGIAATTHGIQLGPLVACTSFRNPALLAKMADALDEISDGRFVLGLGAGWHQPEYDAFGYPFDHRAARFEEALKIIVPLLREGHVDFKGEYYEARDCSLRPRGPSRNGPPIWIGAHQPRMMRLVAQYADAYNTVWHKQPAGVAKDKAAAEQACEAVGRAPETLELTAGTELHILAPGETPPELSDDEQGMIVGEPEQVADALRGFEEMGVRHLVVVVAPRDARGVERLGEVARLFREG